MALMFKQSRLNMRGIKRSTKLLINSKAMWKNAERPRFDSTVKSSKFMVSFNNRFLRERGMACTPKMKYQGFSLHFPKELSYGYLRFEGNGKIPLGR